MGGPNDVVVTGGVVTKVQTDEIRHVARAVRAAADATVEAADACVDAASRVAGVSVAVSPVPGQPFSRDGALDAQVSAGTLVVVDDARRQAVDDLGAAERALRAADVQIRAVARRMEEAGRIYDGVDESIVGRVSTGVEGFVRRDLPAVGFLGDLLAGTRGLVAAHSAGEGWDLKYLTSATAESQEWLAGALAGQMSLQAFAPALTWVPGISTSIPEAADAVRRMLSPRRAAYADEPVVTEADASRAALPALRSAADLLRTIDVVYDTGSDALPEGSVAVQKIARADGSVGWVVSIPGTQGLGSTFGAYQDLQLMSEDTAVRESTDSVRVVLESMRRAGVRPGEEVMLSGHSQGGMVALTIAGMSGSGFAVRQVVTAGAPAAAYRVPAGIKVLSTEVGGEAVSALDGAPNPATPDRVTVRDRATPDEMGDDVIAHGLDHHLAALDEATTRDGSPALQAHLAGIDRFLDGTVVEQHVYGSSLERLSAADAAPRIDAAKRELAGDLAKQGLDAVVSEPVADALVGVGGAVVDGLDALVDGAASSAPVTGDLAHDVLRAILPDPVLPLLSTIR